MDLGDIDFGTLVEGVVELDPMSGRLVLRIEDGAAFKYLDVQKLLEAYQGQEVRFVMTPMASVARLAAMVEAGELPLDQVPEVPRG